MKQEEAAIPSKLKLVVFALTGGRPMTHLCNVGGETFGFPRCPRFVDRVSGEDVHRWRDGKGRVWMATSAWSLFRVPTKMIP